MNTGFVDVLSQTLFSLFNLYNHASQIKIFSFLYISAIHQPVLNMCTFCLFAPVLVYTNKLGWRFLTFVSWVQKARSLIVVLKEKLYMLWMGDFSCCAEMLNLKRDEDLINTRSCNRWPLAIMNHEFHLL